MENTTRSVVASQAQRIVVKIGSSSLTREDGSLNLEAINQLTRALADAHNRGIDIVLVSSGAVAAGATPLNMTRPKTMSDKQAAAMVGQSRLMAAYEIAFANYGITVGQVLLTVPDVIHRKHYANAQHALKTLLGMHVIPVVNENDAVVTDELRFGDNDRLAALTSHLIDAQMLVLLTDVDGLYSAPPTEPGAHLIEKVSGLEDLDGLSITGRGSSVGTGGMRTKVAAAELATSGGVGVVLTSADNVEKALNGEPVGTWFVPSSRHPSARSLWLEHVAQVRGHVTVDAGARQALTKARASLLLVGVTGVAGRFAEGDLIEIKDETGRVFARGLSAYNVEELLGFVGSPRARGQRPVVHANDIVRVRVHKEK
ncbi:glutamate 5-kinase [Actinotignum urinale]|uniref:glutamate 5-kinase n=1 Tax=Actinotignum urinale TaxID=190146 RepID=UPI00370D824A